MQIDLREIEALHARYAREPVVIDLENQIRAIPAPLLLSCKPASRPTLARSAWNARWKIGRVSLMVIGGTVVCAALGMGAARLWPPPHSASGAAPLVSATKPASPQSDAPQIASTASAAAQPLTAQPLNSQALESSPRSTPALAVVDPSALMQDRSGSRTTTTAPGQPAATTDEQKAIASPIRQQRATTGAPVTASAATTAQAAPAQPIAPSSAAPVEPVAHVSAVSQASSPASVSQTQPRRIVRHLVHLHPAAPRDGQPAAADAQKSAAAPTPRNGDVQLF